MNQMLARRLLIRSVRYTVTGERDTDWGAVVRIAARNKSAPLLYQSLKAHGVAAIAPTVSRALCHHSEEVLERNTVLAQSLLDVVLLFDRSRVLAVPYRGPVLSLLLYNSIGLRQMSDLDFIVSAGAFDRATEILVANGFTPLRKWPGDCTRTFYRGGDGLPVTIDLHSRIARRSLPAFGFSPETILSNTNKTKFLDREIVTFTLPYTFLILNAVITKEWIYRRPILAYASDICRLTRMLSTQDVSDALSLSSSLGIERATGFAISVSSALLGLNTSCVVDKPMPRHVRDAERIWAELSYTSGLRMVFFLRTGDLGLYDRRVRAVLRYFAELAAAIPYRLLVPTEADHAWVYVHSSLHWLYPMIRAARLAVTYVLLPFVRRIAGSRS
jgi:hypothetical protein